MGHWSLYQHAFLKFVQFVDPAPLPVLFAMIGARLAELTILA